MAALLPEDPAGSLLPARNGEQPAGQRAVLATIESDLTAGAAKPREMPEPRKSRKRKQQSSNGNGKPGMGDNRQILLMEDEAALQFAEQHNADLRYCHDHGAWFEWVGSHWRRNSTGLAFHWAREPARQLGRDEDDKTRVTVGKAAFAGQLADRLGSYTAFVTMAMLAALGFLMVLLLMPETRPAEAAAPDGGRDPERAS